MEQDLHLFTPVSQGLPEKTEHSYWYNDNNVRVLRKRNTHAVVLAFDKTKGLIKAEYNELNQWREIASGYSGPAEVTHWLDLSKLTTKERAENLSRLAFTKGFEDNGEVQYDEYAYFHCEQFINENKHIL